MRTIATSDAGLEYEIEIGMALCSFALHCVLEFRTLSGVLDGS